MIDVVLLHRDPLASEKYEHVAELPAWIGPGRAGTYWHQPRSAHRHCPPLRSDCDIVVSTWCGQALYRLEAGLYAVDEPPEDLRCGTCLGRRLGYDREDGAIFQPRDHWTLPTYCPGESGDDGRNCFACGARTRIAGGYRTTEARHRPTPELAVRFEPCPAHGWSRMQPHRMPWPSYRLTGLVCGYFGCDFEQPLAPTEKE